MSNMYTRILMTISFLLMVSAHASVHAEESESERTNGANHGAHPPHDHPDNDHIKKLDEGLRKSRRKHEDESVDV